MKRILSFLIAIVFIAGTSSAFACPGKKATNGLKDILNSPSQITGNVKTEMDSAKFFPFGFVGGLAKGTFYMGKQVVKGTWKIVTAPVDAVRDCCKLDKKCKK